MDETPKKSTQKQAMTVDWDSLRQRLENVRTNVEQELTPEEKQVVLRKRAKALARPLEQDQGAGTSLDILEFLLTYETYAIELRWVAETYPLKELTPLPCTPT